MRAAAIGALFFLVAAHSAITIRKYRAKLHDQENVIASLKTELGFEKEHSLKTKELLQEVFRQDIQQLVTMEIPVTVTAYTARAEECDATPYVTADMTPSRIGLLAVSRDLLSEVGLRYGQRVLIPQYGVFEIRDTMNPRYRRRVDILHATTKSAFLFGKREARLVWLADTSVPE